MWGGASLGPMAAPFKHSAGVGGARGGIRGVTQCVIVVYSCKHGSGFNRVHPHGMLLSTTPPPPPTPYHHHHHHPTIDESQ